MLVIDVMQAINSMIKAHDYNTIHITQSHNAQLKELSTVVCAVWPYLGPQSPCDRVDQRDHRVTKGPGRATQHTKTGLNFFYSMFHTLHLDVDSNFHRNRFILRIINTNGR